MFYLNEWSRRSFEICFEYDYAACLTNVEDDVHFKVKGDDCQLRTGLQNLSKISIILWGVMLDELLVYNLSVLGEIY